MDAYKPSGNAPVGGILLTLLVGVIGGAVLGVVTYFISQFIYLIIVFPILLGAAGGMLTSWGIKRGKLRNGAIGAVIGLLIGLTIYGSYRYTEYIGFRSDSQTYIVETFGEAEPEVLDLIIDDMLLEETGSSGFWGFIQLSASEGMSIGRVGRGSQMPINSTFTWIYWVVELGIIAGMGAIAAMGSANEPFCETCDTWFAAKTYLGGVEAAEAEPLLRAIQAGDFRQVAELLKPETGLPSVDLRVQDCACEANDSVLIVENAYLNNKQNIEYKLIAGGMIPAHTRAMFAGLGDQGA